MSLGEVTQAAAAFAAVQGAFNWLVDDTIRGGLGGMGVFREPASASCCWASMSGGAGSTAFQCSPANGCIRDQTMYRSGLTDGEA